MADGPGSDATLKTDKPEDGSKAPTRMTPSRHKTAQKRHNRRSRLYRMYRGFSMALPCRNGTGFRGSAGTGPPTMCCKDGCPLHVSIDRSLSKPIFFGNMSA